MRQQRLNDAAIALSRALSGSNFKHGIFGGCAVAALGGPCEAKDIDCLVASDQQQMLNILDGKDGFRIAPHQDAKGFVAFSWDDGSGGQPVTVELSLVSPYKMQSVVPGTLQVHGERFGDGPTCILDEVHIFKGKLRAAAIRAKDGDAADLTYLESTFGDKLRTSVRQFNQYHAGLALKRYPHLEQVFQRVGVDVGAATNEVEGISLGTLPLPQAGDIQKSLLE